MLTQARETLIAELIGPLNMHFKRGEAAYQNLYSDGRQFLFTKILRDNNREIRSLILHKGPISSAISVSRACVSINDFPITANL